MGLIIYKKIVVLVFIFSLFFTSLNASVYKTYSQWEVDAIMVAWLIHSYVEKDSEFMLVEKGSYIDKDYAINTPNSKFRRGAKETAFESALRQLRIGNSCTDKLVPIIRVVELAPWRKSEYLYILNFEQEIVTLLHKDGLNSTFLYIDNYCKKGK